MACGVKACGKLQFYGLLPWPGLCPLSPSKTASARLQTLLLQHPHQTPERPSKLLLIYWMASSRLGRALMISPQLTAVLLVSPVLTMLPLDTDDSLSFSTLNGFAHGQHHSLNHASADTKQSNATSAQSHGVIESESKTKAPPDLACSSTASENILSSSGDQIWPVRHVSLNAMESNSSVISNEELAQDAFIIRFRSFRAHLCQHWVNNLTACCGLTTVINKGKILWSLLLH